MCVEKKHETTFETGVFLKVCIKGAVSRGFCSFRSILCLNHYFEAFLVNKMLQQIYDQGLTIINFFEDFFEHVESKLEKNGQLFQVLTNFNPCYP